MDLKRLTLLHSNDMHGDFFDEQQNEILVGGIARLSGYVQQTRKEDIPALYVIAGDMLQGSIIDQEFKGISTIDIINALSPDIVTLGNHELDYGLGHLMFLEKCAKFPIINANLYIKPTGTKLFQGHKILEVDGIRILFIGIITEEVMEFGKKDPLIGSFVDINDAAKAVEYYCNNFKDIDIDLTVLLTHIGFDSDKQLAAALPPELGVDLIIGGHSHTLLEEPYRVGDILIVQVGCGTDQIGRFDLVLDRDTNAIHSYEWNVIPISDRTCPIDPDMHHLLQSYKRQTDYKFTRIIRRLGRRLTHPSRFQETELGNYFADIFAEHLDLDIVMIASGSIRTECLDALVTLKNLRETFPYDERILSCYISGKQLREMLETHLKMHYSPQGCREFYQINSKFRYHADRDGSLLTIDFDGTPIVPERLYRVGFQELHFLMLEKIFGVSCERITQNGRTRIISTSSFDIVDEAFEHGQLKMPQIEGRIVLETPIDK